MERRAGSLGLVLLSVDNDATAAFTWGGLPPNQGGTNNAPLAGSDLSMYFVTISHRF